MFSKTNACCLGIKKITKKINHYNNPKIINELLK